MFEASSPADRNQEASLCDRDLRELVQRRGIKKRKRAALSALEALQGTLGELNDIAVGSHMTSSSAADAIHQEQMARVDGLLEEAKMQYQELASLELFWQA
jgi:CHAD domain-containing protein